MSNELIKEIIKSHVYGMSVVEMSQAYGLTEEEISSVNGTYTAADDGTDGYSKVTVSV